MAKTVCVLNCPRCGSKFYGPRTLKGTYCHTCFHNALSCVPVKSLNRWQISDAPGIIFLGGIILLACFVIWR